MNRVRVRLPGIQNGVNAGKRACFTFSPASADNLTCSTAARAGARILVVDPVVGAANEPQFAKTLDIAMMVTTRGGKERTSAEWRSLLTAAGFGVSRIIPTASYASVIEAIRD